jgi:hypothetical protein
MIFGQILNASKNHVMRIGFKSQHWADPDGNPAGGSTYGTGFAISWQNGPLGRDPERKEPNGAFVEDVIAAAADRIDYYQQSRFACEANASALLFLRSALQALNTRTADREQRGVEGTHAE